MTAVLCKIWYLVIIASTGEGEGLVRNSARDREFEPKKGSVRHTLPIIQEF